MAGKGGRCDVHLRGRTMTVCLLALAGTFVAGPSKAQPAVPVKPEARSLLGKPLYAITLAPEARKASDARLAAAHDALAQRA